MFRSKGKIFCVKKQVAGGSPKRALRSCVISCACICSPVFTMQPYELTAGVMSVVYVFMHVASYEIFKIVA